MQTGQNFEVQDFILTPVRTAGFGMLTEYMEIAPEKLHAQQPSVLFQVDLPQAAAMGMPQAGPTHGVVWANEQTPVVVVGFCVGKVYIAAAFNPLDPATRARMEKVRQSGKFTCALEFNVRSGEAPAKRFDWALIGLPLDVFSQALLETEGMPNVDSTTWLSVATPALLQGMVDAGLDEKARARLEVRVFSVIPAGEWHETHDILAMLVHPTNSSQP